jgi:hypothetical protein
MRIVRLTERVALRFGGRRGPDTAEPGRRFMLPMLVGLAGGAAWAKPAVAQRTLGDADSLSVVPAGQSARVALPEAVNPQVAIGGVTATPAPYLSKIASGQIPVLDMFGPYRDGVRGDETLLNAILNGHNACYIKPNIRGVGPVLAKDGPIIVPQNGKLIGIAGRQSTTITRLSGYTGDTLQMGSPTSGMGSAEIEGLWFTAPGRFLGAVPAGTRLGGRLTAGQAHIRAYGSQSGAIRNCGGMPIPYFIAQQGGYGLTIENSFTIGGLWDRTQTALQEAIAVLVTNYDPVHGHPTCTTVINPNWVGGNSASESRTIKLYSKSYECKERIGPKYGWLHAAGEDCQMIGGFAGGFNRSPIAILPGGPELIGGKPAWVQIKFSLLGARLDESMWAGIEARRADASQAVLNILSVSNCEFNGQLVGAHGIDISPSPLMAVARLRAANLVLAAFQGAGARFYAVDGGEVHKTDIHGFNSAGFDTTKGDPIDYGTGLVIGGLTRNVAVTNLRGGGGPNGDMDPNNGQHLFADTTPVSRGQSKQGNSYHRVRATNLGLAGGAPAMGGVNDTAG